MIKGQTLEVFLDELGSKKPTPGGGAVAAVSAAMAASLIEMVAALTKNDVLKVEGVKAKALRQKLLDLADADVAAFDAVMSAYRSKDKTEIKKALKGAMAVPQKVADLAEDLQKLAAVAAKKGNPNAYSDARTALHLAKAAAAGALENVKINEKALAKLLE